MGEAEEPVATGVVAAGDKTRCVGPVALFRVGAGDESEGYGGRRYGARLLAKRNSGSAAS